MKDEKKEDEYISDINNIKCIKHEEYDKSISNLNKENSQNKDTKTFKSDSKYVKEMMTRLKNRALVLESLVNFYFMQFKILPLPNLIMNLDYISNDKNKPDNLINLFFEWDGCYLYEGKKYIFFATDFILPFSKEMKYKINKYKSSVSNIK